MPIAANMLAANIIAPDSPSPVESDYSGAHLFDTGECSIDVSCPKNSPTTSTVDSRAYTAGHFALELGGQFYARENAPGVGCSDAICGNTPVLDPSLISLYDLIV
jgi:hypothetical protein